MKAHVHHAKRVYTGSAPGGRVANAARLFAVDRDFEAAHVETADVKKEPALDSRAELARGNARGERAALAGQERNVIAAPEYGNGVEAVACAREPQTDKNARCEVGLWSVTRTMRPEPARRSLA